MRCMGTMHDHGNKKILQRTTKATGADLCPIGGKPVGNVDKLGEGFGESRRKVLVSTTTRDLSKPILSKHYFLQGARKRII